MAYRSVIPTPPEAEAKPAPQFDSLRQQYEADALGIWIFLASEILFFGGVFMTYTVYRAAYPEAFEAASGRLDLLLGGINTAILLTSSLTMTLADDAVLPRNRKALIGWLAVTAVLGAVFLAIKGVEYSLEFGAHLAPIFARPFEFPEPHTEQARLFFSFYFALTGLHAVHLFIGIVVVLIMLVLAIRGAPRLEAKVTIAGLYWHLVDLIWVFVFPLLYLAARHG
jgi:cytochrome c oxidase subunit 3